ncbi:MAG: hypothetical protein AAGH43_05890 [Pseudomonadota bacterium]
MLYPTAHSSLSSHIERAHVARSQMAWTLLAKLFAPKPVQLPKPKAGLRFHTQAAPLAG